MRKCSTEVSRFVMEILEKSKFIARPVNTVAFLFIALANSTPFLIHSTKFHMVYLTSTHSHFHVFKPIVWVFLFYWNSLIQKNSWAMTSSEWKLYVAAKLLTNFKHLKGVSTFLLILDKKHLTYKISNERRVAIASVVGLDNLSLNLWIIILRSIT